MRFIVWSPEYDPCSAGVKVLHYLAALLNSAGFYTDMGMCGRNFFNPYIGSNPSPEPDDIVVYPDIVAGNPLGATLVVRYMLYYAREHYRRDGGVGIPKTECVFYYMDDYREDVAAHWKGKLSEEDKFELPTTECPEWFYPEKKTIKNLVFNGKQHCMEFPEIKPWQPMPVTLFGKDRAMLRRATIATLRATENLYTLDHHTALEQEAQLCGCKVWRVHGAKDFREQVWPNPENRIMNPRKDVEEAKRFAERAMNFFVDAL